VVCKCCSGTEHLKSPEYVSEHNSREIHQANYSVMLLNQRSVERQESPQHDDEDPLEFGQDDDGGLYSDENGAAMGDDNSILPEDRLPNDRRCFTDNGRRENNLFFQHHSVDQGLPFLLSQSQTGLRETPFLDKYEPLDLKAGYLTMQLALDLSQQQRDNLACLIDLTSKQAVRNHTRSQEDANQFLPSLPRTPQEMRTQLVEGTTAALPNLAHPEIYSQGEFAYCSLIDCYKDLLGQGYELGRIQAPTFPGCVSWCGESPRAQQILERAMEINSRKYGQDAHLIDPLVSWIILWEDDYDPNSSTKNNRGSHHIKSATIGMPLSAAGSIEYTYVVTIGPSKDGGNDLEAVEKRFKEDLEALRNGVWMYSKKHNGMVLVYADVLACLQDQPARRAACCLMLGSSNFGARFGYNYPYAENQATLPSCNVCHEQLRIHGRRLTIGTECCQCWEIPSENKLSFRLLKGVAESVHDSILSGEFTETIAKDFMSSFCINDKAQTAILEHATNAAIARYITEAGLDHLYEDLTEMRQASPSSFEKWQHPSVWSRGLQLEHHIAVVMHLIFLGIQKTVMQDTQVWLKKRLRYTSFLRAAEGIGESIECLHLSWCQALAYGTGTFGSRVSENYLADCRLAPWLNSLLALVDAEAAFEEPVNIAQEKWLKKTNEGWLRARGLDTTGNAATLRARVAEELAQPDGPAPILEAGGGPVALVVETVSTFTALVSRLMSRTVSADLIDSVSRHIKLFLDSYDKLDKALDDDEEGTGKFSWVRHYNFTCLEELVDMMRQLGPLFSVWEGSYQGEKIIGIVKPETGRGFRKGWARSLMTRVQKKMALRRLGREIELLGGKEQDAEQGSVDNGSHMAPQDKGKMIHVYKGIDELQQSFLQRKPLSCLMDTQGRFWCLFKSQQCVHALELTASRHDIERLGLHYHIWNLLGNAVMVESHNAAKYCLALPKLLRDGLPEFGAESSFTMIASDWSVLQEDLSMSALRCRGCTYNEFLI